MDKPSHFGIQIAFIVLSIFFASIVNGIMIAELCHSCQKLYKHPVDIGFDLLIWIISLEKFVPLDVCLLILLWRHTYPIVVKLNINIIPSTLKKKLYKKICIVI